jgi:catechol 2,3-dioxygenase-like lactoylglutathione lyase family enzyme
MSATNAVGITGVGQVSINVYDVRRAIGFYRDVLGLPLLFEIPNAAFFQAGGVRLYLAVAETPELDHPASVLYYRVPDIHAAYAAITAAGAAGEHEPRMIARMTDHDLWLAFFHDSEGNLAALMAEPG